MLKKTTVYLEESEISVLKKISFIQNKTMANLIREGVQHVVNSFSEEELKALNALDQISDDLKARGVTDKKTNEKAIKAQREVRRGRKKSRR